MLVCMRVPAVARAHMVKSVTLVICSFSPRVRVQELVVFCFIYNNGI